MILLVVAAAIINHRGRVLMQRRPLDKQDGGLWEFPGGKIESGESAQGALVREIAEELGLVIVARDLMPVSFATSEGDPARQVVLMLFSCRTWQGEPQAEEGAEIAWVDAAALRLLDMPLLDIPLAHAIEAMLTAG